MTGLAARYRGPIAQAEVHAHGLTAAGLAEDGVLAAVLDRYPPDLFDINLYDFDDAGQASLRTGARGRLSGTELLEAIKQGRLWVNMRQVAEGWPELWRAAAPDLRSITDAHGVRPVSCSGQLILSSPKARVPYHFDAAGVVLLHMRGRKRLFVYPGDEAHLPEQAMELVVSRQTTEETPYRPAFEADAQILDLEPGQAATWPFYAPHRVENLDAFCVSLSIEFQTWSTRLRNGALYVNAVQRLRGRNPSSTDQLSAPGLAARWAAAVALKRMGAVRNGIVDIKREFEPAVGAVDGARVL